MGPRQAVQFLSNDVVLALSPGGISLLINHLARVFNNGAGCGRVAGRRAQNLGKVLWIRCGKARPGQVGQGLRGAGDFSCGDARLSSFMAIVAGRFVAAGAFYA